METSTSSSARTHSDVEYQYVGDAPEELQCPVCLDPFVEPHTSPCGHTFCERCLPPRDSFPCPVCRTDITKARCCKEQNRLVLSMLGRLEVYCCNRAWGCEWVGPRSNFREHTAGCSPPSLPPETARLMAAERKCEELTKVVHKLEQSVRALSCLTLLSFQVGSQLGNRNRSHRFSRCGCCGWSLNLGPTPISQEAGVVPSSALEGARGISALATCECAYDRQFLFALCSRCLIEYRQAVSSPLYEERCKRYDNRCRGVFSKDFQPREHFFYCEHCSKMRSVHLIQDGAVTGPSL